MANEWKVMVEESRRPFFEFHDQDLFDRALVVSPIKVARVEEFPYVPAH
jgi:hypothetical protein